MSSLEAAAGLLCAQKGRILHSGVHVVEGSFPQHHTCPCGVRAWEEDLPVSHSEQLTPAVGQCAACGLSCTSPEQPAWGGWVWCPLPVPPPSLGKAQSASRTQLVSNSPAAGQNSHLEKSCSDLQIGKIWQGCCARPRIWKRHLCALPSGLASPSLALDVWW